MAKQTEDRVIRRDGSGRRAGRLRWLDVERARFAMCFELSDGRKDGAAGYVVLDCCFAWSDRNVGRCIAAQTTEGT